MRFYFAGENYSPRQFLLWFVPVADPRRWPGRGRRVGPGCTLYADGPRVAAAITQLLPGLIVSSLCFAGMLYLFSLPFLYLAFRSALYGERFHELLRLPEYVPPVTTSPEAGESSESPPE